MAIAIVGSGPAVDASLITLDRLAPIGSTEWLLGSAGNAVARIESIVGDFSAWALARGGWNQDDAVAALEIAACCAYEEGK